MRIQKICEWVYQNIEKRPVLSVSNALETLENRMGDCNEHAVLFAALPPVFTNLEQVFFEITQE